MKDFSFLTNTATSERSQFSEGNFPKLDLGSILHNEEHGYLLCLQAICDTVRGNGNFFFVLLEEATDIPDHIVPHGIPDDTSRLVSLNTSPGGYTASISISFGKIDPTVGHIPVSYNEKTSEFFVEDSEKTSYRWLSNI